MATKYKSKDAATKAIAKSGDNKYTKAQAKANTGVTTKANVGNAVSDISVARTGAVGSGDFQCVGRFKCSLAAGLIDHFDLDIEWYSVRRGQWVQLNNATVSLPTTSVADGYYTYTFTAPSDLDASKVRFRAKPVSGSRSKDYTYYVAEKKTSGSGKNKKTWWEAVKKTDKVTADYFSGASWSGWSNSITGPAVQDSNDAAAKLKAAVPDKPAKPTASLLSNNAVSVAFEAIDTSVAANCRVVYRCVDGNYTNAGAEMSGKITAANTASFVDSKTAAGHEYRYYLRSVNTRSNNWSAAPSLPADLCDPVRTPPVQAVNVKAACYGEDGARVTFNYPSSAYFPALTEVRVYYASDRDVLVTNKTACQSVEVSRGSSSMAAIITGLDGGMTWYFAVWFKTGDSEQCQLFCSSIASCIIASTPDAPTIAALPRSAYVGESIVAEWIHNNADGSAQTAAQVQVNATKPDGTTFSATYAATTDERCTIPFAATSYVDSTAVSIKVRTKGAGPNYGEWSEDVSVTVYAKPNALLTISGAESGGDHGLVVSSLPLSLNLSVHADTGTLTQSVVQWRIFVTALEMIAYQDAFGNDAFAAAGETIADIAIDSYDDEFTQPDQAYSIAATDAVFVNGGAYKARVEALMNSGLSAEPFEAEFEFSYEGGMPTPTATIIPTHDWGARIYPMLVEPRSVATGKDYVLDVNILRINPLASPGSYEVGISYTDTDGEDCYISLEWDGLDPAIDASDMGEWASVESVGYIGASGAFTELSGDAYQSGKPVENALLSVYRIGRDGEMTAVAVDYPNGVGVFVTDMHPTFGEMVYRIVANDQSTDEVTVCDVSEVNGWDSILIQWNEDKESYTGIDDQDAGTDEAFPFDFVELPWNITVQQSSAKDVAYKNYVGRAHPVALFGTQVGTSGSWQCEIVKHDEDWELSQLRRLETWMGECWVRDPSGLSYPANVDVSTSRTYDSMAVAVSLEVTRVDG